MPTPSPAPNDPAPSIGSSNHPKPNLEHHRKLAKALLHGHAEKSQNAARRLINYHPHFTSKTETEALAQPIKLADAQLVIAREARFDSWAKLKHYIETLNAKPQHDQDAQFEAAADHIVNGRLEQLRALLTEQPALITARSPREHHATLLHYVAANGVEDHRQKTPPNAVDIANLLIGLGADIHARAGFYGAASGSTPLVALVTSGHPKQAGLMEPLIRAFAAANQPLDDPQEPGAPLLNAFMFRMIDAAITLADSGTPVIHAYHAAGLGMTDLMQQLITPGTPPTAEPGPFNGYFSKQQGGEQAAQLALVFACMAGQTTAAAKLIALGIDINSAPYKGWSALHEACVAGHLQTVKMLIEHSAAADRRDEQWLSTPAEWADVGGHKHIADYLIKHATVHPADLVLYSSIEQLIQHLNTHPEHANGINNDATPLCYAAALGNEQLVQLLLERGSNPALTDPRGKTADHYAEIKGHTALAQHIRNASTA